jgi:hypothetical protein
MKKYSISAHRLAVAAASIVTASIITAPAADATPTPPTLTVTPTDVQAGENITISGTGCVVNDGNPVEVNTDVLDSADNSIAGINAIVAADGTWTTSLRIPTAEVGTYTVTATCDRYVDSIQYTAQTITVSEADVALAYDNSFMFMDLPFIGHGFTPGEQVRVILHSDPVAVLGTFTADETGTVKATVTTPGTPGTFSFQLLGLTSGRSVSTPLYISDYVDKANCVGVAPPCDNTSGNTSGSGTGVVIEDGPGMFPRVDAPPPLPHAPEAQQLVVTTGADTDAPTWTGLALISLGTLCVVTARRRTYASHRA